MSSSGRSTATWSSLENLPATATSISLKWVCSSPVLLLSHLVHWYGCSPCFYSLWVLWQTVGRNQTHVGRWGEQIRWKMDRPVEERWRISDLQLFFLFFSSVNLRLKFPVLGKPGLGHAGRAVHGGRGDLRRRRLHQVPGGHTQVGSVQLSYLLSSLSTGRHYDESTNTESLSPYHMNWIIVCSIWNRTACDQAVTNRIRDTFRRVWILHFLSLLADVQLIYIDSWDIFRRVWILHFYRTQVRS